MAISVQLSERVNSMVNNVLQRLSDDKMSRMKEDWRIFNRHYRGVLEKTKKLGESNLFIQATHNSVETIVSRIRRLVLSADPPFDVSYEGGGFKDNPEVMVNKAKVLKGTVGKQFRNAKISKHVDMFTRVMAVYGTGIMKYYWKNVEKTVKTPQGNVLVRAYDGPAVESKDPFNIFLIGEGETVDELDGVMERMETTLDILKKDERRPHPTKKGKFKGFYYNLDKVQGVTLGDNVDDTKRGYRKYDLKLSPDEINSELVPVELYEYWTDFDLKDNGKRIPCVLTVANGVVIRAEKNPFDHQKKPYLICPFTPLLGMPWGIGLAELIYHDQRQLNSTYNQMMDDATYTLHNMWKIKQSCPTKKHQLTSGPNQVFKVNETDDITPLVTGSGAIMNTGIQVSRLIQDNINNTTGAQPILQGQPLRSRTTATEVSSQEQAGMAKIVDIADRVSDRLIRPLVEMFFELDKQFMDRPPLVEVSGPKGMELKRLLTTDLDFDYMFKIVGAMDVENKMVRQQQLQSFLNIVSQFPPNAMAPVIASLLQKIWQTYDFSDGEQIITPEVIALLKQSMGAPQGRPGEQGQRAGGAGAPGQGSPGDQGSNILGAAQQRFG